MECGGRAPVRGERTLRGGALPRHPAARPSSPAVTPARISTACGADWDGHGADWDGGCRLGRVGGRYHTSSCSSHNSSRSSLAYVSTGHLPSQYQ
eukprot:975280-Rhodomonas_salina.1